jgi:tRNA modification GTPase
VLQNETIVALATPPGAGGLAVVRLSGPDALAIARRVFRGPAKHQKFKSHQAVYGILFWPESSESVENKPNDPIDQAVALPMLAPHGYTGEDTVEFFCHGGRMVSRAVVGACRAAGAAPAPPGEFTRRAFLNGKLSLDQAEAVADLIQADSEAAARGAIRQLLGGLNDQLGAIESPLLGLLAGIEGSLEFVDEEEITVPVATVVATLEDAVARVAGLLALAPAGRLLRDGVHVVLAGPPNVGKSSLFNALLQEDRAIVDPEAGTTRDVVSARLVRGGTVIHFHDTAGLRDDPGRIEKMGIDRTWKKVNEADLVLLLTDAGKHPASAIPACPVPVIPVLTKADLTAPTATEGAILTSSTSGQGLDLLWAAIDEAVEGFGLEEAVSLGVVLNERHLYKLEKCRDDLKHLLNEIESTAPGDEVVGTMLASILSDLGEISGRVFTENLLESVFQRFCVGK